MRSVAMLAAAIIVLLCALEARGAECKRAHGLEAGKAAPCSGILHGAAEAVAGERCLLADLPLARAKAKAAAARCKAAAELARHKLRACRARLDHEPAILRIERPPPWWRSRWLWGAIGLAAGVAAGYSAQRLTPAR